VLLARRDSTANHNLLIEATTGPVDAAMAAAAAGCCVWALMASRPHRTAVAHFQARK